MWFDLVFRWLHILSAAILVGGAFFMRFSLAPLLARQSADTRQSLLALWRPGWARLVMLTSGLLLVSGLVNAVLNIQRYRFTDAPYHALVAVKLVLALVVFWLSAILSGRSENANKFREKLTQWLNLNLVFAILVVALGGYMKLTPRTEKSAAPSATTEAGTAPADTVPSDTGPTDTGP